MTPLDDELRQTLSARAATLAPAPDPMSGIEARVSRIRRRRAAMAVSGAVAVVAAVALAVPGLVPDRDATRVVPGTTPSASTSKAVLDPAHPWPLRGDEMLLSGGTQDSLQRSWTARHPGSSLTPLFVQRWEPSGQTEVAFFGSGDGTLRMGWATIFDHGPEFVQDEAVRAEAAYQFAMAGDEGVTRLYVVAAPDSKVEYSPDGVTYRDITQVFVEHKDGVGTSTTTSRGGIGVTAVESADGHVRVKAADGSVVYENDAKGGVVGTPANVLDWPSRGNASVGPDLHDLEVAFTRAMGRSDGTPVGYRPLFTGDTDSGVRFTLGQAWFEGDTVAYTVSYATSERSTQLFLGPVTPDAPPVLAFVLGDLPGTSVDLLVVVPTPRAGQVSYDADATGSFRPITGQDYLGGVVLIDRAKDANGDRLEIFDGNGNLDKPLFRGPVAPLLCGVKECG